jgi:glycosyltransferase involved in cell wall biosynthesis
LVVNPHPAGKTVLFVAGEFPPIKTIGRLRATKFVEHLRDDGWSPIVLTIAADPGTPGYDPALEAEVPAGIEIIRVPWSTIEARVVSGIKGLLGRPSAPSSAASAGPPPGAPQASSDAARPPLYPRDLALSAVKWTIRNWVEVPDNYGGWANRALAAARELCRTRTVDLVFTTLPPFSAAKIGYRLKREFGIPWVVDYRDLWVGDVLREWVGPVRGRIEQSLERRYMRAADLIVAVSEQKTEFLKTHLPNSPARRETLTNGYDPEIFAPYLAEPRQPHDTIDFVFTGRLFKNRRGYAFAEALGQLAEREPRLRSRVRVHILGGVSPEIRARYDEILARYGLADVYRFAGDIPYHEAMRAQVQADYLLLIVDTGATASGVIPGKLFEYVAARRPIFALTDPGATQEIIERGRLGIAVPAEDVAACRTALAQWLGRPVPERLDADEQYLAQFDRRQISARLSRLLQQLV